MWVIKVLMFLWPFLKEMILGPKSVGQAIQTNKMKVLTLGVVLISFMLNFFMIPRLVAISSDYLTAKKEYEHVLLENAHLKQQGLVYRDKKGVITLPVACTPATVPVVATKPPEPPPEPVVAPVAPLEPPDPVVIVTPGKTVVVVKRIKKVKNLTPENSDRYSKMKDDFDRIKQREAETGS